MIDSRLELEKIRLSRFKIDKFVHLPIFKKTVVGCFARIGIGHNKEKNVPVYRVAEITDVCETAKVYDVMKSRTNIGLRMRHGKQERVFRAQFISNQPFSETEFQKWKQTCEAEHVEMPTNQVKYKLSLHPMISIFLTDCGGKRGCDPESSSIPVQFLRR